MSSTMKIYIRVNEYIWIYNAKTCVSDISKRGRGQPGKCLIACKRLYNSTQPGEGHKKGNG